MFLICQENVSLLFRSIQSFSGHGNFDSLVMFLGIVGSYFDDTQKSSVQMSR